MSLFGNESDMSARIGALVAFYGVVLGFGFMKGLFQHCIPAWYACYA